MQLLTQVHLLSRRIDTLNHEAAITKHYLVSGLIRCLTPNKLVHVHSVCLLQDRPPAVVVVIMFPGSQTLLEHNCSLFVLQVELQQFASSREEVGLSSSFRGCNLQGALDLLQEVEQRGDPLPAPPSPPAASRRWLPRMTSATNSKGEKPTFSLDGGQVFLCHPLLDVQICLRFC